MPGAPVPYGEVSMYTGYGLVLGAALGLLVGTLLTAPVWIALLIGAGVGLIIGATVDGYRARTP